MREELRLTLSSVTVSNVHILLRGYIGCVWGKAVKQNREEHMSKWSISYTPVAIYVYITWSLYTRMAGMFNVHSLYIRVQMSVVKGRSVCPQSHRHTCRQCIFTINTLTYSGTISVKNCFRPHFQLIQCPRSCCKDVWVNGVNVIYNFLHVYARFSLFIRVALQLHSMHCFIFAFNLQLLNKLKINSVVELK